MRQLEKRSRNSKHVCTPRTTGMNDPEINATRRPVAYKNEEFLDSPDARALRILSEYLEPLSHFRDEKIQDTIVFFGSARLHEDRPAGPLLSRRAGAGAAADGMVRQSSRHESRRFVVCTGGGPGIMEAANRGATMPAARRSD